MGARDDIVKKDLMDTKEEQKDLEKGEEKREDVVETNEEKKDLEKEEENPIDITLAKEENQYQSSPVTKPLTSNIEELMEIVDSLDEDSKAQKIASLREELIKLQMEQTNLMPSLPAEIVSHLPPEILQGIEGAMKDAYLEMAKENLTEDKEKEEPKIQEVEKIITEYFEKEDESKEEQPKDKRSEVENMITEFMESDEEEELAPKA